MAISLIALQIKHERRVRLVFSAALAAGAFSSTSYYGALNLDGGAASPGVQAALVVSSSPNVVELQLDIDLVQGALYRFSAVGVPAIDTSTTPNPSELDARVGQERRAAAVATHGAPLALDRVLYGEDVRWSVSDFQEDQAGDLAETAGIESAHDDIDRRLRSNGVLWDNLYGLRAREYVDAVVTTLGELDGSIRSQVLADDRVESVDVQVDASEPDSPVLIVDPKLIGSLGGSNQEHRVPLRSS